MLENHNSLVGNFPTMLNRTKSAERDYLIKQLPSATAFIDTNLRIVHASDQWLSSFDFNAKEVFGKTIFELFGPTSEKWRPTMESCLLGQPSELITEYYLDSDNNKVWIEWCIIPWYNEKENVIGAIIQTEDVTQRVADQQKIEKLGVFLDEKSEMAKVGSWEFDIEKNHFWWCDMTKKIYGVPSDFTPSTEAVINFFKEGEDRQSMTDAFKLAQKGMPWSKRLQITTPDGHEKWVICSGRPHHKNGEYVGIIGTFQDVTDSVLKDVKTRESERMLRTLIDNLPVNVFIKDLNYRKILVNKSELEFYGLKHEDEMLGKDDFDIMDPESARSSQEEDFLVIDEAKPILGKQNVIYKKNGESVTFLTSKIPLLNDQNKVIGLLGFSLDISNLKQNEEDLKNLINVTSLQNKKLLNFAHIISHNLRSHAANFSMLLDFLVNEKSVVEKTKLTGMLIDASDNLLDTLDNLNEVVAININTNLDKKSTSLNTTISKIEGNLSAFLKNNNAIIINSIPDDVHVNVIPAYLESILMNFITNGVKYKEPTRDPVIKLNVKENNGEIILSIEDNGLGIDLEKYGDKLFGMYKTFHNNKDARGIGLYITKNQIEAMNGRVVAHSEVGKGTTFNIYFNGKN